MPNLEEKTQLKKWISLGGKLRTQSRKLWKKNKKNKELYPYLEEDQAKRHFSVAKLIMLIGMVAISISFMKQFLTKNLLLPSTITKNSGPIIDKKVGSVEDITRIVYENIPTQIPIKQTVLVPVEVIKYIEVTPTPSGLRVKGKYSWYYPPLGGINCDRNADGTEECEFLGNGDRWQDWYERGAACPAEWAFGQKIKIIELDLILTCIDRGGAINKDENGFYWIDHLTNSPRLYWSSTITIELLNN